MPKLDSTSYRTMRWKNGGGMTTEVLTLPTGADLDTFELRVSVARVETDGPFSIFPGIDRTLVVTDGAGMALQTADDATVTLDAGSPPFSFTGDDPVHATLTHGPVSDFNVMTRRSALRHHATRLSLGGELRFSCAGELSLLLVLEGQLTTPDGALDAGDLFAVSPSDPLATLHPTSSSAELLRVDVFRLP